MRFSQLASFFLAMASSLAVAETTVNYWQGNTDVKMLPLKTHSLASPYLDSDMQSRWWEFGGDTIIRTDQYVRLTSQRQSQRGWIFSRVPLTATNWEIEFEFKIHGDGHFHGDGFALWVTKQRASPGPVFGSEDRFEGLGIFFDTYKNNRPGTSFPYVMAMMGDGQTSYDKEHDGKANELAGCSARGIRDSPVPSKARLTYFQDKSLTLDLQYKREDEWTECFSLNAEDANIAIPSVTYIGLSGETGEVTDKHDIISLTTHNLYDSSGSNKGQRTPSSSGRARNARKRKSSGGGWMWFFFKIFLFLAAIVGAYVGFTIYRSSQRQSRF